MWARSRQFGSRPGRMRMIERRRHPPIWSALTVAAMIGLWIAFAPTQFGGNASYILINGNSMEPGFHRGDLVILRAAERYDIGDVATYRHPDIGYVIHRIVARDGDRFVLKGDNNDWLDSYQPLREDFIGKLWLRLPRLGTIIERIRAPWILALIAAGAGGIAMSSLPIGASQRRQTVTDRSRQSRSSRIGTSVSALGENLMALFTLLALASLALGVVAFTRPVSQETQEQLAFDHTATFRYSAAVPAGVYDASVVRTGDPIFRRLTDTIQFDIDYRLSSSLPLALHGSYRLLAEISETNGWKRTIELAPATPFRGYRFSATGTLDLRRVESLITNFETHTGVQRQQYVLAIVPDITVEGTIAGQTLQERFAPRLVFTLDKLQLQVTRDLQRTGDSLVATQAGTLARSWIRPNTITLFGRSMTVSTARTVALIGAVAACAALVGLILYTANAPQRDAVARIKQRYDVMILDARSIELDPSASQVAVQSLDDLALVAQKMTAPILHLRTGDNDQYLVHVNDSVYRYTEERNQSATSLMADQPEPWQTAFLAALQELGSAAQACRAVNIGIRTAYRLREQDAAFARAWDAAIANSRTGAQVWR